MQSSGVSNWVDGGAGRSRYGESMSHAEFRMSVSHQSEMLRWQSDDCLGDLEGTLLGFKSLQDCSKLIWRLLGAGVGKCFL